MAKVKLGYNEFDVDCEAIIANFCKVSDAECVTLGARIKGGEFQRVKTIELVRFFSRFFHRILLHCFLCAGNVFVWCGAVRVLYFSSWR
jgi:hypothetical protein